MFRIYDEPESPNRGGDVFKTYDELESLHEGACLRYILLWGSHVEDVGDLGLRAAGMKGCRFKT